MQTSPEQLTGYPLVLEILGAYGIQVPRAWNNVSSFAYYVTNAIADHNDPVSAADHEVIFDEIWNLGNKERCTSVQINPALKRKIIAKRADVSRWDMMIMGHIEGNLISCLTKYCNLDQAEMTELWRIFHELWPEASTRDCEQINYYLGTYKLIDRQLKTTPRISVLDIGCGSKGRGISTLCDKYGADKINGHGVDLEIKEWPPNVHLVQCDTDNMPYPTNSIDLIYSNSVIYYFKGDPGKMRAVLTEILRVAKPGAPFIFDGQAPDWAYQEIVDETGIPAKVTMHGYAHMITKKAHPTR